MQKSLYFISIPSILLFFLLFSNCETKPKEENKTAVTQKLEENTDNILASKQADTLAATADTLSQLADAKLAEEKAAAEKKAAEEKAIAEKKAAEKKKAADKAAKAKKEKAKKTAEKKKEERAKASREKKAPPKPAKKTAKIKFAKPTHEFGMIAVGDKVEHTFKFTNTGAVPLLITDASSTCGCTIPKAPKEPIMPGQQGDIHVIFDSTGKIGSQTKEVILTTNGSPKIAKVRLKGTVVTEEWLNPPKPKETSTPAPDNSLTAPK